jgi:hypothetical protein
MKYLLLIHQGTTPLPGSAEWEQLSEDEQKAIYSDYQVVNGTPASPRASGCSPRGGHHRPAGREDADHRAVRRGQRGAGRGGYTNWVAQSKAVICSGIVFAHCECVGVTCSPPALTVQAACFCSSC